jgi:hypothetical protein
MPVKLAGVFNLVTSTCGLCCEVSVSLGLSGRKRRNEVLSN